MEIREDEMAENLSGLSIKVPFSRIFTLLLPFMGRSAVEPPTKIASTTDRVTKDEASHSVVNWCDFGHLNVLKLYTYLDYSLEIL